MNTTSCPFLVLVVRDRVHRTVILRKGERFVDFLREREREREREKYTHRKKRVKTVKEPVLDQRGNLRKLILAC